MLLIRQASRRCTFPSALLLLISAAALLVWRWEEAPRVRAATPRAGRSWASGAAARVRSRVGAGSAGGDPALATLKEVGTNCN